MWPEVLNLFFRFSTSFVYWGLFLNAGSFGDVFLNTALSAAIEIPSRFICYLCLNYLGRRAPTAFSLIIGGAFCVVVVPVLLVNPGMSF